MVNNIQLHNLLPILDHYVLRNRIQSALGYMASVIACGTVKMTNKSDMYGFCVLILEVVPGRKSAEHKICQIHCVVVLKVLVKMRGKYWNENVYVHVQSGEYW